MEKPKHTNRLSKESSPYLLQHAHNPVNWYPWGEEAFEKAQKEDKPILVSIGYSTCHWCHVMERESFENEAVAHYMNDHFVNIKVDREERPDIDQIYMDAIQALTGAGGWPLNCFLTPDLKPFYGGTYFPPSPNYGRASWRQVLMSIANAYHNKNDQVAEQTERLMDYISNSGKQFYSTIDTNIPKEQIFSPVLLTNIFHTLKKDFDVEDGGFGNAPKFPGTMTLDYLLQYHYYFKDDEAIKHVNHSLERMIYGGIYDQLGGGFSRYSTDAEWLAPHFEKMLYDNALLVRLLSDAYAHTNNPLYLETIEETLEWVSREMTSENGGFFTALDADSEGVEGKFYVWEIADVYRLLGDDAPIFNAYYDISPKGNWEGVNIPRRKMSVEKLAMKIGWEEKELSKCLQKWKTRLFLEREKRIRPGLDDKILLDWNALMCTAYCKAAQVTGKEEYFKIAEKNMAFIYANMKDETGFYHSYAKGKPKYKANLLDCAYLIEALIQLYQTGFGICYIHEAITITDMTIAQFYDEQNGQFYFSPSDMDDLPVRQKDVYDNAMPSGNAVMVHNLQQLQVITGKQDYGDMALKLLSSMKETLEKYPLSFSKWATACFSQVFGFKETAIVGKEALEWAREVNTNYIPQKNVMASLKDQASFPLLKDRQVEKATFIYLCSNFRCSQPVDNLNEYMELVKENSPMS